MRVRNFHETWLGEVLDRMSLDVPIEYTEVGGRRDEIAFVTNQAIARPFIASISHNSILMEPRV